MPKSKIVKIRNEFRDAVLSLDRLTAEELQAVGSIALVMSGGHCSGAVRLRLAGAMLAGAEQGIAVAYNEPTK